jgi:hypothetical protein
MTKVFIGGSRQIARLDEDVRRRLDSIIEKRLAVIIGDANGADKAVQRYLHDAGYRDVEVFCTGAACRNNFGNWPVRTIKPPGKSRDFAFYAAKDAAMAGEASVGLMIWDQKSVGTLMNVLRLVDQNKTVVLYLAPDKRFVNVKTMAEWEAFISRCAADLRRRLEEKVLEASPRSSSRHPGLF